MPAGALFKSTDGVNWSDVGPIYAGDKTDETAISFNTLLIVCTTYTGGCSVTDVIARVVAALILILGVPVRFKYVWQGTKIRRRKSARDISRKFYITSWVIYALQVLHNLFRRDWIDVVFWGVGTFTVAFCISMCYRYWHVKMSFPRWLLDSFRGKEEGGLWR